MTDERSVHPYLRNNSDSGVQKVYTNSDYQRLLWTIVFYEKSISKHALAEHLGVSTDTIHAWACGELRIHSDTIKKINEFALTHNPKNRKLANAHLPKGWTAVPLDLYETLDDIINMAIDLKSKVKTSKDNAKKEE